MSAWFRQTLKRAVFGGNRLLGRFQPMSAAEQECVQGAAMPFTGDLPSHAGTLHNQFRLEYKIARPATEVVEDLLVAPTGMAWHHGALIERYSLRSPAVRDLLQAPAARDAVTVERAVVIQGDTPYSYGDWMAEFVRILARFAPFAAPLVVPQTLMSKSYVQRDLKSMGIQTLTSDRPFLIKHATVLRQTEHTSSCWSRADVAACRRALGLTPSPAEPGSLVYISRLGDRSETRKTGYPSEMTGSVVQELGGVVLQAGKSSPADYAGAARHADTVIYDHGSAVYNAMLWQPRNFIELYSDGWWNGAFLSFGDALGAPNYALVRIDGIERNELRAKLAAHLAAFGARAGVRDVHARSA